MANTPGEKQNSRFEWLQQRVWGSSGSGTRALQAYYDEVLPSSLAPDALAPAEIRSDLHRFEPTAGVQSGGWHSLTLPKLAGGRIRCLAIDAQGQRLFAGAASGGLWRSTRANGSWSPWEPLNNAPHFAIGALAVDPDNQRIIYAGTGEPYVRIVFPGTGLLVSRDGGDHWAWSEGKVPLSSMAQVLVDPNNSSRVFCAGEEGLYESPDRGKTWRPLTFGNITSVAVDSTGRVVIGVYGTGLFRAECGIWERIGKLDQPAFSQPTSRVLIQVQPRKDAYERSTDVYFARLDHEVWMWKATEPQDAWSYLGSVPSPEDSDWASHISVHPQKNLIFAGGSELFFREFPEQASGRENQKFIRCSFEANETAVRLVNQEEDTAANYTFVDHHAVVFDPAGTGAFAACDGGVFSTDDVSKPTWKPFLQDLDASQIYDLAVSPKWPHMIGGGTQDLGTWIRNPAGRWIKILGNDGGHLTFDPFDGNIIWCQWQENKVHRVELEIDQNKIKPVARYDVGLEIDPAPPFIGMLIVDARRRRRGYLYTGRDHVFRVQSYHPITKKIARWERISPSLGGYVSSLAQHPKSGSLYAGTSTGRIWWCCRDGAKAKSTSWVDLTDLESSLKLPRRLVTRIVVDDQAGDDMSVIYACFGGTTVVDLEEDDEEPDRTIAKSIQSGQIFRGVCMDSGDNWIWKDVSGKGAKRIGGPVYGLSIDRRKPGVLYACTEIGVFRATDEGLRWERFSTKLPLVPCFDIHLHQPDDKTKPGLLRVATHGRGIWEIEV